jgi:hypothetical protein
VPQEDFSLGSASLAALLVPAALYIGWQHALPPVTPNDFSYGIGGILLGLFICSRPARNGIDVLIFERMSLRRAMRGVSGVTWLILNALVMLAGWFVIVVGALRLSVHPD